MALSAPVGKAHEVRIDPFRMEITSVGLPAISGTDKWTSGVLGEDGCIYGVPYSQPGIYKLDPQTNLVETIGSISGSYKHINSWPSPPGTPPTT